MGSAFVTEPDRDQMPSAACQTSTAEPSNHRPIESTIELHRLTRLTQDGVLIVQNETMLEVNRPLANMCGYTVDKLIGRPLSLLNEKVSIDMACLAAEIQDDRSPSVRNRRAEMTHLNGQHVPISINTAKINLNGNLAVIFLVTDLSSKCRTEDDLQKNRHLESIAALSGGIAHDYNNLLTVIIGNISLIQSYIDPNDIIYRLLREAQDASMVAKSLTQKLITFSKGGLPAKETADMAALLRIVTEFSLSGSNIKCRFDIPDGIALVDIDKTQVSQAMHNLVMNARDAMPKGGIITVSATNVQNIDGDNGNATGTWVKISIRDEGTGIPPENLEKIYDPYFSTKGRGNEKGTGLGLSICHSIIQKHDGVMEIESSMGEGTAVHIYLRASENPRIAPPFDPTSQSETSVIESGRGRILVMDDEDMITKMAGRILARLGYEADFARDGHEAVELYRQAITSDSPFDAVILDLTVRGGMGGEEAVQQLLKIDPSANAIVSSGYSDSPVMHDFADYGFCGVVVKPYSLIELGRALNRTLNPQSSA